MTFFFFSNKPTAKKHALTMAAAPAKITLPSPPAPSALYFEHIRQHAYAQLVRGLERTTLHTSQEIRIELSSRDSSPSSFSSRDKQQPHGALSLAEHLALLADIRSEVAQNGWRVISCGLRGSSVRLFVQPANDQVTIPGPADFWPQINSSVQLMDVAQQDLIRAVTEAIMLDGPSLQFSITLPVSCQALQGEELHVLVGLVRMRVAEKWFVDQFGCDGERLHCILRWQEASSSKKGEAKKEYIG
ncbi:hypothetical protein BDZ88DRAFT_410735 [Geranomyces variabilis]|nr:hypothetical protein BDZ88DRAFT_410735 [Geranomyces variabilis]KAJ3138011.1 hypothetical protein HDU90_001487 [Geranomyces variabilis]